MIEIKDLSISTINGRNLLKNINFTLNDGDKMAIIGEEGNGKTTLIKTIYNRNLVKDSFIVDGQVNYNGSIGYLEQMINSSWNNYSPIDYFLQDYPDSEPDYEIYNEFGAITKIIKNLGLKDDFLETNQSIGTLSGGEKVKLQLAKILYKSPDIILLDEPTNDLDIQTLELLEKIIKNYKGPVIYVSHDETLLENTANCILHIEQIKKKTECRCTFARLPYKEYVSQRIAKLEKQDQMATSEQAQRAEQVRVTKEIKSKIQSANPGRTNSMRAVLAREARWEKQGVTEHTDTEDSIKVQFSEKTIMPKSKVVLDFSLPVLSVNDKILARDINLKVIGPQKIVIIGSNGTGKSTLIKDIYNYYVTEQPSGIKMSYMPQNYEDFFVANETPVDFLSKDADKTEIEFMRMVLGRLKFTPEEMVMPINSLSGGQKAKIYLTKLMTDGSNVLLLDEPTRNLSPLSNPAIRGLLNNFGGAIISVSHDRKFIKEVCNEIYELTPQGLKKNNELINDENLQ